MFEINYMSDKKRILNNIESEQETLGTQSRIYDCTTGLFTRILTNGNKSFSFTETGIGWNGILQEAYSFTDVLDCDEDEKDSLAYDIIEQIDSLSGLSIDDINYIIQNGFLQFLSQRNLELTAQSEFRTLLRAEQILMQYEKNGKIGYNEVLQEINNSLEQKDLSEGDRKILEQLKSVYENYMFKAKREGDTLIQEEQNRMNNSLQETIENKDISAEMDEESSDIELRVLFRNATSIQEKLRYFSEITDDQIQIELLDEVPKNERHKFIGRIKTSEGIATALNSLEDEKSKRKTFNFIAKQFKGNNEGLLSILTQIDFDVEIPSNMLTFQLNNLNALNLDFLINIQKHATNHSEMKFKINEYQGDSKKIDYSFNEISAIIAKIEELTADIPDDMDEASKFYKVYSRITQMMSYDHKCIRDQERAEYDRFHSKDNWRVASEKFEKRQKEIRKKPAGLYGGLVEGKAICAGYALILNEALKYVGIKCQYVRGTEPKRGGHAWNQIQIDGKWYNADPTWDSEEFQIYRKYQYMLLNDEDFNLSHGEFSIARTKTEHRCKSRFDYSKIQGLSPNQIRNAERGGYSL